MSRRQNTVLGLCLLAVALPIEAAAPVRWTDTARIDLKAFPDRLKQDAKATFFREDNLAALAWAGLASVVMNNSSVDDDVADHFYHHDDFTGFSDEAFNMIGQPGIHFGGAALWYVLSADKQNEPGRQKALTMLSALTINGVVTGGLKMIRQNDQPDGEVWAWPSGHTSSSFTVASVLDEFYGPKVGIPAYVVAGLVGWRMMDDGDHWASDVLFGAVLGWVVGHTVAGQHEIPEIAGFEISPYYGHRDDPGLGVNLSRRF